MRKKMGNAGFTILYPGLHPKSTLDDYERRDQPAIYITRSGEFVSINGRRYGGELSSAVFYNVEDLRALRDTLDEAIDLFAEAQANPSKAQP